MLSLLAVFVVAAPESLIANALRAAKDDDVKDADVFAEESKATESLEASRVGGGRFGDDWREKQRLHFFFPGI